MKRLFASIITLALAFCLGSCNDNDNNAYYLSASGDGALTINYNVPLRLSRMVVFSTDVTQDVYLMGGSAYVSGDSQFAGRGACVHLSIPTIDDSQTLLAQSFDINNDDYIAEYSTYIDFNSEVVDDDYTDIASGTAIIRRSGTLYDIQILGKDSDEDNIIISYRGYIYRGFTTE